MNIFPLTNCMQSNIIRDIEKYNEKIAFKTNVQYTELIDTMD